MLRRSSFGVAIAFPDTNSSVVIASDTNTQLICRNAPHPFARRGQDNVVATNLIIGFIKPHSVRQDDVLLIARTRNSFSSQYLDVVKAFLLFQESAVMLI